MAQEVKVPTLGESVSEATIGQWLKQPGEAVALDEPIVSLETDKVAIDVGAPAAGVLSAQLAAVGDTVVVGAVIATIAGTLVGALSGFYRGWTDAILMRLTDVMLSIPTLPLVLLLSGLFRPSPPLLDKR